MSNKLGPIRGGTKTFKPSLPGKKTKTFEATKPTTPRTEPAKVQEEEKKQTAIKKRVVENAGVGVSAEASKEPIALKQEVPKWMEEISIPENLTNREVTEVSQPSNESWINSIAQPTVGFVLKMMLSLGSATPNSLAEIDEYDRQVAMMAKGITESIQSIPSEMQHRVVSNLTNMVSPISTLVTKYTPNVKAAVGKNLLPFYKNLYLTLSQLIIDALLNEEFANAAKPLDLAERKTISYISSELCWESTTGIDSEAYSIMNGILQGPLYNVMMDSFVGGYGPLSSLIKGAVKLSINQIAKLPIRQAVNVVMEKLTQLAEEQKA